MSATTPSKPTKVNVRPWRKALVTPTYDTLISEEYIDVGTQRKFIITAFVVLQSYKLNNLASFDLTFVIKYTVLEALFISLLPILRIPRLVFSKKVTVLLIALMAIINLSVGSLIPSLIGLMIGAWKLFFQSELTISGSRVRSKNVFDTHSHLSGRHVVQILPESTGLFNPTLESFCLDKNQPEVHIPVRFNATDPIFIQLNKFDFDTSESSTQNFTKKDIRRLRMATPPENIEDNRLSYYSLPVSEPGLYRIHQVTDASKLNIRLYRSDVLVSVCPSASISGKESDGVHRCIGDTSSPKITVNGVPPFKIKYTESINGEEKSSNVQTSALNHVVVPHVQGSNKPFFWKKSESLSWASSQPIDFDIKTSLGLKGEWTYYVDEVEDALGNVVNYNKKFNERRDFYPEDLTYRFTVHSRPQINFHGCSPEKPIRLRKGSAAKLPIAIGGVSQDDGPFTADFEYISLDDDQETGSQFKFSQTFNKLFDNIKADKSGMYKLLDFSGNYCQGSVFEPSTCLVYVPPEPQLSVNFASVEDKCAGPVGVTADLSLSGTPPFVVNYRVFKDNIIIKSEHKIISQSRDTVEFKPTSTGTYKYEFFRLGDEVYKNIDLHGPEFGTDQTIRALASASFSIKGKTVKACSGDSIPFAVNVQGIAPFKLTYEIIYGAASRSSFTKSDITENVVHLTTPPLKHGGKYTISLVSIEDSHGCLTNLNEPDMYVEVRRDRPGAAFLPLDGSMEIKTLEGRTVGLPLKLSGEGPWEVEYSHKREDGSIFNKSVFMRRPNGEVIAVDKKGEYKLLSVKDAYCPGEVTDSKSFDISWVEKPQLTVIKSSNIKEVAENLFERREICENDEDVLELGVSGKFFDKINQENVY